MIVFNKKTNKRIANLENKIHHFNRYLKQLELDLNQIRITGKISLALEDKEARSLLKIHAELIQELWEDASMGDYEEGEVHDTVF